MRKTCTLFSLVFLSLFSSTVLGAPPQQYGKVAIVAQSGGDYTDVMTAMNNLSSWCGSPSANNPCLLKIMPGVYDIGTNSLQMQPYVDIEGSGENVTIITSNTTAQLVGTVIAAANSEIRFLTIRNTSGSYQATTLSIPNASAKISNVTVEAAGTAMGYGIYMDHSDAVLSSLTVSNAQTGIYINAGSPYLSNIRITNTDIAILPVGDTSTMNNLYITGTNQGIRCFYGSSSSVANSMIKAADTGIYLAMDGAGIILKHVVISAVNYGIHYYMYGGGGVIIDNSEIASPGQTLFFESGTVRIANTKLDGGAAFIQYYGTDYGTPICKFIWVYDGNYDQLSCPPQ